jgi:hypothetical protein
MTPEGALCVLRLRCFALVLTPRRFLQNSAQAAAVVILYYDHLLTFPAEVRVIWHRGARRATWAFLLLRYLSFVIYVPIVIFSFVPLGPAACQAYFDARQGVLVLSLLIVAGAHILKQSRNRSSLLLDRDPFGKNVCVVRVLEENPCTHGHHLYRASDRCLREYTSPCTRSTS